MADENNFVAFVCSSCKQELEAPHELAGQAVECPACGARLIVAAPQAQPASSPAQLDAQKSRTIRIELGDL